MAFESLLGSTLIKKGGESISVSELDGKVVGFYFSAHWCPPCRGFTPQLAQTYNKFIQSGKNFEIVFVSSDNDSSSFSEYFATMPWLALPFNDRQRKESLSARYGIRGIPSLVILGEDGTVITTEGRNEVMGDPEAARFPWKKLTLNDVIGTEFFSAEGVADASALQNKVLGLYFSAHWCGPCRQFTPRLANMYKLLKQQGKDFEVIFVTCDREVAQFEEYFATMPWLAIAFGDKRISDLSKACAVQSIPKLVILDAARNVLNSNAVNMVSADPQGASFPWVVANQSNSGSGSGSSCNIC